MSNTTAPTKTTSDEFEKLHMWAHNKGIYDRDELYRAIVLTLEAFCRFLSRT